MSDSRQQPGNGPRVVLDVLRTGSEDDQRDALNSLYELLIMDAQKRLGHRNGRADFQAESIVHSALAAELGRGALEKCNDDAHLKALLRRAVRNKLIDRTRKSRPKALPDSSDAGPSLMPAASGPGPETHAIQREQDAANHAGLKALEETLLRAPLKDKDIEILKLYLFDQADWQQIGERSGLSSGAARKRMTTKIRPKVVAALFRQLRSSLDGRTWTRISDAFILKQSSNEQAENLPEQCTITDLWKERIEPEFEAEYGRASLPIILRLLGRVDWSKQS